MSERILDICILSYGPDPAKLARAIASIRENTVSPYRLHVVHNPSAGDDATRHYLEGLQRQIGYVACSFSFLPANAGYAGGVNVFVRSVMERDAHFWGPEWPPLIYCDNDVVIRTRGWDVALVNLLEANPELGMVFPSGGPYPLDRPNYREVMWGVGFCWAVSRKAWIETGPFDETLGHQEEADYALRLRMKGYRLAADPGVLVEHDATASSNPASSERINAGVVRWVDKWNEYFCGKGQGYHSPNVLRWEDWPPNALYLEQYWKTRLNGLNAQPEKIQIDGREMDLLKVPRFPGLYAGRII